MIVHVPSPLQSYTNKQRTVEAEGDSLRALLQELDSKYPGIRFRMIDEQDGIRRHIKLFVNSQEVGTIDVPLNEKDVVHIICALSGG